MPVPFPTTTQTTATTTSTETTATTTSIDTSTTSTTNTTNGISAEDTEDSSWVGNIDDTLNNLRNSSQPPSSNRPSSGGPWIGQFPGLLQGLQGLGLANGGTAEVMASLFADPRTAGIPAWIAALTQGGANSRALQNVAIIVQVFSNQNPDDKLQTVLNAVFQDVLRGLGSLDLDSDSSAQEILSAIIADPSLMGSLSTAAQALMGLSAAELGIEDDLQRQFPVEPATQCAVDLQAFAQGLQQQQGWAMQMFDATGKLPAGVFTGMTKLFGDYEECMAVTHTNTTTPHTLQGQLCDVTFATPANLASVLVSVRSIELHVCLPKSCTESQIASLMQPTAAALQSNVLQAKCIRPKDPTGDKYFIGAVGTLTAFLFIRETNKSGLSVGLMVRYYVHRYWRLTPLYALFLAFYIGIFPYLKKGPFQDSIGRESESNCRDYWLYNIFYFNNLAEVSKICFGWSWYLANDMQFYFIAPLILVPWTLGGRARIGGFALAVAFVVIHVFASGIISYEKDVSIFNRRSIITYMGAIYFVPWCRVGPYAIGLIFGYFMATTGFKYPVTRTVVIIDWTVATAVGLILVYVHYDNVSDLIQGLGWNQAQIATYEALAKVIWAVCVVWLVFACYTGNGGFVNTLLSWRGWIPLSRLSYGVYLSHLVIYYIMLGNYKKPLYLDGWTVTEVFLTVTVLSFLTAFLFSLLIEAPALGVEKAVLGKIFHKKKSVK